MRGATSPVYCSFATEREAISATTAEARENARDNDTPWVERVLLWRGDTLRLRSTVGGRITREITAGWDRDGVLFCSRRVAAIAMH